MSNVLNTNRFPWKKIARFALALFLIVIFGIGALLVHLKSQNRLVKTVASESISKIIQSESMRNEFQIPNSVELATNKVLDLNIRPGGFQVWFETKSGGTLVMHISARYHWDFFSAFNRKEDFKVVSVEYLP